jgi:hypothetical protein
MARIVKNRPTATVGAVYTAAQIVVGYLVAKGYVPAEFAKQWGWLIEGGVTASAFLLVWFHVVPAAKVEELSALVEGGALPDADHERIAAAVREVVAEVANVEPYGRHAVGDAHPDAEAVGAPEVPTLAAGATS